MSDKQLSRRGFVGVMGGTPKLLAQTAPPASPAPLPEKGLRFSAMVTFGDWAADLGVWGEPGISYILTKMKRAGFSRVYWRSTDGCGQATYPSRVTNPAQRLVKDDQRFVEQFVIERLWPLYPLHDPPYWRGPIDFGFLDSIKLARDWAQRLGLEFHCWHEHAEDHGALGAIGIMGLRHPEWFTLNRDGKASHCRFSLAIPAAVDYRLAWVREVMGYEPDGIHFDFVKSIEGTPGRGCTAHFDDRGIWYCGYEKPMVDAFRSRTGQDPFRISNHDEQWVRFRAEYLTAFLGKVRELQRSTYPKVKIGIFGCPRNRPGLSASDKIIPLAEPLFAYLEDHETWTRDGLLDEFVSAYTNGEASRDPSQIAATVADAKSRVQAPCRYRGSQIEVYGARDEATLARAVEAAGAAGCEEVVFFESTPLEANRTWDAAAKVIRRFSR